MWWIKIQEGCLGSKESQNHTRLPDQGSNARKINPHNFWLQKPVEIESVEEAAGVPSSSSWGTYSWTHLFRLTPSELQHWGSSLKGTSGTQGGTEMSRISNFKGTAFFQTERQAKAIVSFLNPPPAEPQDEQAGAISGSSA